MTLPSSGPMSASMINVELGRASNAPFNINGSAERALAGKPSGAISFSDFYGKSNLPPTTGSMVSGASGNNTGYSNGAYLSGAWGSFSGTLYGLSPTSFNWNVVTGSLGISFQGSSALPTGLTLSVYIGASLFDSRVLGDWSAFGGNISISIYEYPALTDGQTYTMRLG